MTSTVTIAADLIADTASPVLSAAEQEELIRTHMPLVGHLVRDMLSRIPNHQPRPSRHDQPADRRPYHSGRHRTATVKSPPRGNACRIRFLAGHGTVTQWQ